MDSPHKKSATDYIAKRGRNQIGNKQLSYSDVSSLHHGKGYEKHVGYAVFIAKCDKCHNGNLTCQQLLSEPPPAECQPHSQAHAPVGADAF